MLTVMKRELSAYFHTPIGYIVLAIFYAFAVGFFINNCLMSGADMLVSVFSDIFFIIVVLIPIITMRLVSEEKRHKTDQALFTSPIGLYPIAMGKFLAALVVFLLCLPVFVISAFLMSFFTVPEWSLLLSNLIGIILLGSALISVGMFFSSLTESQVISAFAAVGAGLFIFMYNNFVDWLPLESVKSFLSEISFMTRYSYFTTGIINFTDIVFFLSVTVLFIFLTVRVFEKKRYS